MKETDDFNVPDEYWSELEVWRLIKEESGKPRGIRNRGGYLLFFPDITRYPDQEERYQRELKEQIEIAQTIVKALNMNMTQIDKLYQVQYSQDKLRLWIHCSTGETVARYDVRFGMDIHTTIEEQCNGADQCLMCTHGKSSPEEFEQFCFKVKELWRVEIDKSQIIFNNDTN